jgi:imidazolonepropionase-like amidohydrolase
MDKLIKADLLIDGTGAAPRADASLLVHDGRIAAIGAQADERATEDTEVVDLRPFTLVPGLIDAHVHLIGGPAPGTFGNLGREDDDWLLLRAASNARMALASGITTLRDCGGRGTLVISLARAVAQGMLPGPHIVSCGAPITTTGGHCYYIGVEVEGVDEGRKALRAFHREGADFIKIMVTGGGVTPGSNSRASQFTQEELNALAADAHRLGHKIAGHVHGTEGICRAVAAGFDTLEHCSWLALEGDERDYRPDVVDEIKRRGAFVCRTIAGFERVPLEQANPDCRFWPVYQVFRNMVEAGVKIAAGTDSGIDHTPIDGLVTTLETMAGLGCMSNEAVLASATRVAAEALGLADQVGTLEVGKRADLIAVTGNPLQDLRALRDVEVVLRDGHIVAHHGLVTV